MVRNKPLHKQNSQHIRSSNPLPMLCHSQSLISFSRTITSRTSAIIRGVAAQHPLFNTSNHGDTSTYSLVKPIRTFSSQTEETFKDGKPTLKYATTLNKTWSSMSNEQILHFAHMEVPEACRECIIRDVMMVDQIEYDEVC